MQSLRDRDIRDAGDTAHLCSQSLGVGHVRREVATDDLDVEGCRQAKVQNLRRDVPGRKGELRAREKFREPVAQNRAVRIDR